MLQMGNFEFHFSSLCIKNEAEENAFVLVVKSVAQGVCGVPDGSQMGPRWVVYYPCLWTRSLEVWEMLQMGNFKFHISSLNKI